MCCGRTRQWRRRWLDSEARSLIEFEIVVPAIPRHLDDVHQALARLWGEVDRVWSRPPDPIWRAEFATGVGEIAANIIQHAYPSSAPGLLACRLRVFDRAIEACLSDSGPPYVPTGVPPSDPPLLAESGRGLALAQAAVDELTYKRAPAGINEWCLRKRSLPAEKVHAD